MTRPIGPTGPSEPISPPYNVARERLLTVEVNAAIMEAALAAECGIREAIRQAQGPDNTAVAPGRADELLASLDPERCEAFTNLVHHVVNMRGGAPTPVRIYERQYDASEGVTSAGADEMVTFGYPIVEVPDNGEPSVDGCWLRFTNSP